MNSLCILHLANDYSGSRVYKNLVSELDKQEIVQKVYTPVKSEKHIGRNTIDFVQRESVIYYSFILNKHLDRIFYKRKVKKIFEDSQSKIDINSLQLIHAHTWYSDGGVAYELSRSYNIPYIITIRNTDLNLFWKFPHLKSYGLQILNNASQVILISEAYKKRLLIEPQIERIIKTKKTVIPNGVAKFWIENAINERKIQDHEHIKLLFVGRFNPGKNVLRLMESVLALKKKYSNLVLSLVGGTGSQEREILKMVNMNPTTFNFLGHIQDENELLEIYRAHQIFVMPSKSETFGLVYVEALLQGLPILYTRNEGIDGMYGPEVGEAIEKGTKLEIASKIETLIQGINDYNYDLNQIKRRHNWSDISKEYISLYRKLIISAKD